MLKQPTIRWHLSSNSIGTTLLAAWLIAAGCASTPKPDTVVLESPRGAVYLEPISNRYLEAAHPVSMPPETIARVLRGVLVQGRQTALDSVFSSDEKIGRVFSEEDVTFLTPLLVKALSGARPTQQIRFRVTHMPSGSGKVLSMSETGGAAVGSSELPTYGPKLESTSATLYVYGLSLYLTVTEFRQKPGRPDDINMPNRRMPDASSLDRVEFLFAPKAALRPESYQDSGFFGEARLTPIIIDYELLTKLPSPKAASRPASQPQPADSLQERASPPPAIESQRPAESDSGKPGEKGGSSGELQTELQAVKEELREIKKQLAEQDAERDKQKQKKKPTQPSP
jgi:hypothetical protein